METVVETISRQSQMSYRPHLGGGDDPSRPPLFHHSSLSLNASSYHAPTQPGGRSEDAQYRAILDRVVEKARRTTFGTINSSGRRDTLSSGGRHADAYESFDGLDVVGKFRSTNQLERDKKIGAAGELFVSKILRIARVLKTNGGFRLGLRAPIQTRDARLGSGKLAKYDQNIRDNSPRLHNHGGIEQKGDGRSSLCR